MTETGAVITWEAPSETRHHSSNASKAIADALRAQKGQWAVVEERVIPGDPKGEEAQSIRRNASNRASLIKNGRLQPFRPPGAFDAASRSKILDDGTNVVRVYAVFLGEEHARPPKPSKAEEVPASVPEEAATV